MILFADIFENFKKTCTQYKLHPCHNCTSPGLSWDAMLKMTNIKLELKKVQEIELVILQTDMEKLIINT